MLTLHQKMKNAKTLGLEVKLSPEAVSMYVDLFDEFREEQIRRGPLEDHLILAEIQAKLIRHEERIKKTGIVILVAMSVMLLLTA